MMNISLRHRHCPNQSCRLHGKSGQGNIVRHSFYAIKNGKRRRYICNVCGKSFCSNAETPYYRLQTSRKTFDEVVHMSVEGVGKSSIARIKKISRIIWLYFNAITISYGLTER